MTSLWLAFAVGLPLAVKAPDPADVKPGWLGFGMFLALAVATVLLWLSMRRQLKKVRFEEEPLPDGSHEPEAAPEKPAAPTP
jgi:hypothetical protein